MSTIKSTYKFHKYADLYPLASEEELSRLTEDIKKNGLANPIVLYKGQILDGRNRYIACLRAEVEPDFKDWQEVCTSHFNDETPDEEEDNVALLWTVAQNSHRRHLSTSQLAMVAAKVAEIFQEDAKKRELAGVKPDGSDPRAILPQGQSTGKSTDLAAKVVGGVSGRTVRDAIKVQKASPELAAKVLKGDITVAQAKKELSPAPSKDSKPQKVKKVLPPLPVPEPIPEDIAVPNPKTLKVLDEIEKHAKEIYKLIQYFAHGSGRYAIPKCKDWHEGVYVDSVKEYQRLEEVGNLLNKSEKGLRDACGNAPKVRLIEAILEIRKEDLCNPQQEIGREIWRRSDEFAKLLEPFGWCTPKAKSRRHNLVKERTFATKDDPQPDPPTPPAPKRKRLERATVNINELSPFALTSPCYESLPHCKHETNLWTPEDAQALFDEIFLLPWKQHDITMFGNTKPAPRLFQWMGIPPQPKSYTGGTATTGKLYGGTITPLAWTPAALVIKKKVEAVARETFDSLNINYYRDNKDHLGWHRDKEDEGLWTASIASVSLGATRTFQVRHGWDGEIFSLPLTSGSLVVMPPGFQRDWLHCLAKTAKPRGPRINLTFRRMIPTAQDRVL